MTKVISICQMTFLSKSFHHFPQSLRRSLKTVTSPCLFFFLNIRKPRWWCHIFGWFWKVYLTRSESFCLCTMGKSKEISQDIRKRIVDLLKSIRPWVQFSYVWRCQVHRLKQLYASTNTTQEGNVMLWSKMCISSQEQQKTLERCWLKLEREYH